MTGDPRLWIDLLLFLSGVACGGALWWLWYRIKRQQHTAEIALQTLDARSQRDHAIARSAELEQRLQNLTAERENLTVRLARLEESRRLEAEKSQWLESARQQMRESFTAIARQSLRENAADLTQQARRELEALVQKMQGSLDTQRVELKHLMTPIRENLTTLDGQIHTLEKKREGAYQSLNVQLDQLARAHTELRSTTASLAEALKSPVVRGRWGEIQLRRVVEMAGMVPHVSFSEQFTGNSGGRPDMIIRLPDAGILPVDAKVPLNAYLAAMESESRDRQHQHLTAHAKALRERIRDLSRKQYRAQFHPTPEFVVLFVPNDACMGAAFEHDPELMDYALNLQILIAAPMTLMALLKSVAYGWKQREVTESAREIAAQGREMFQRITSFAGHFSELGSLLGRTVESYNRSVGSYERRILPAARRFSRLQVTADNLPEPEEVDRRPRNMTHLAHSAE